jgi:hypothetical protein
MIFFVFLLLSAHADDGPQAVVWARDPDAIRKFFPPDKYKMLDAEAEAKDLEESGYLTPRKRDALFHKLNLEERVSELDEMDKDILVMDARFEDVAAMKKHHPQFTSLELQKLHDEVRGGK